MVSLQSFCALVPMATVTVLTEKLLLTFFILVSATLESFMSTSVNISSYTTIVLIGKVKVYIMYKYIHFI